MPVFILKEKMMSFLEEDVGLTDITTEAVVPPETRIRAQIIAKESTVVTGIFEAKTLFEMLDVNVLSSVDDGEEVTPGTVIAELEGDGRAILTAERTVLNLLMRMCGIATATRRLIKKVEEAGLKTRVAATRKTAPGLRYFDKKAISIGGGDPHRFRLDDAVLIKDNHITIAGGIKEALKRARSAVSFTKKIEIEAKTLDQALEAAKSGADIIMLDNMTPKEAGKAIKALKELGLRDKILIEISGGVTEENILEYAQLKPDIISLGSLTHSPRAIDISLEVTEVKE